jgi:tetratricopeptide (TPR) repeat protein
VLAIALPSHAQSLTVTRITLGGQPVQQVLEVVVISAQAPAGERRTLKLKDALPAGVELIAPARAVILFVSSNGNEVTLEPGARLRIADITPAGERYGVHAGLVTFNVRKALSFFNVAFEEFVALVRGTRFTVLVEPNRRYRCEVQRGALLVERAEMVRIGGREAVRFTKSSRLLVADGAGGHKAMVDWPLSEGPRVRSFDTLVEAKTFYLGELKTAGADAAQTHIVSGQLRAAAGRTDLALQAYAQAEPLLSSKDPRRGELHVLRARVLMQEQKFAQALSEYDRAQAVYERVYTPGASPELAEVLGGKADTYAKLKNYPAAERAARQAHAVAIAVSPQQSDTYVALSYERLGRLAEQQGEYEAAAQNYQAAIEVERRRSPDRTTPLLERNLQARDALKLELRLQDPAITQ